MGSSLFSLLLIDLLQLCSASFFIRAFNSCLWRMMRAPRTQPVQVSFIQSAKEAVNPQFWPLDLPFHSMFPPT